MANVIPVIYRKSGGGAAIAFDEMATADRIPIGYLASPKGYVDGLFLEWVSATSVRFTSGAAYIPSLDAVVELSAALTKSPTLLASTWFHCYLYLNGTTPDVEITSTVPNSTPFSGRARAKNGDTSRRYIGSFKTDASSNIIPFVVDTSGAFRYLIGNPLAPLRCLSNGKATARATVSLSGAMPVTATSAILIATNTDTALFANMSIPSAASSAVLGIAPGGALAGQILTFPTDSSQAVDYYYSSVPANGLYLDVVGFTWGR